MSKFQYVGKRVPFKGSYEKAQGKALFGADVRIPGMLQACVLRSPYPHARVKSIDISKALKLPGVITIATPWNTPTTKFGIVKNDEQFLTDEAKYIGDEIVAIAAVERDIACKAVELVDVDYELLDSVYDPIEALNCNSPLVHSDFTSNLCHHVEIERGDIFTGFNDADAILEKTFKLPFQYQAYLEPQTATAMWSDNSLTIWAPGQSAKHLSDWFSSAYLLPKDNFRFIQTCVGGAFGGKNYMRVVPIVSVLAKMADAPVQFVLDREEDFLTSQPRVPMTINIKMGITRNGIITAKETNIIADNGAYAFLAPGVLEVASVRVDTLYRFKNIKTKASLVYTNKLAAGGMRGFGNPQSHFAVEVMIDLLANELNIDPSEIRLKNAAQVGDENIHGYRLASCELQSTIELAKIKSRWEENRTKSKKRGNKKYGIGMASSVHVSGSVMACPEGDGSSVMVQILENGRIIVFTGEGELGQGAKSVIAQIVAEELCVSYDQVSVEDLDTNIIQGGAGAQGSRVTVYAGNSAILASKDAVLKLKESAADIWNCNVKDVIFRNAKLINVITESELDFSTVSKHYIHMTGGSRVIGQGMFSAKNVEIANEIRYGNISMSYPFATQVAEVFVDVNTGKVEILRIIAVLDVGQIINLDAFEGQVEGGIAQGLGYALFEDFIFDKGTLLNPNFTDYNVLTIKDVPEIKIYTTDSIDPYGPFGAKSVGELALVSTAAAIANAVYNATGKEIVGLPIDPFEILK